MTTNKLGIFAMLFVACSFTGGCDKNELHTSDYTLAHSEARVKVIFMSTYFGNPRYQIKVNDERVSNILSASGASPNPTPFPGGGLNTGGGNSADYLMVPAQQNTISIAVPKFNTNTDSVQLATSQFTYEAGKKYSLYFTDTAANTTSVLVVDSLTRPDSGYARYKFVNLLPDLPGVDLYIGTEKVADNIPYKGVSNSFMLPTNNASTTWSIREAGGATSLATYASASTLGNQRVYTVIARGYNAVLNTSTSDPRRRAISLVYNE